MASFSMFMGKHMSSRLEKLIVLGNVLTKGVHCLSNLRHDLTPGICNSLPNVFVHVVTGYGQALGHLTLCKQSALSATMEGLVNLILALSQLLVILFYGNIYFIFRTEELLGIFVR